MELLEFVYYDIPMDVYYNINPTLAKQPDGYFITIVSVELADSNTDIQSLLSPTVKQAIFSTIKDNLEG